jgi:hypothetical protein
VRERKEEKVNKEQAQEIEILGIAMEDHNESTGKREEVKFQRDD